MPGGFPLGSELCNGLEYGSAASGSGASNAPGLVATSSASLNTKGSWSALVASSTSDVCFVMVQLNNNDPGNYAVDIGVGGAGSEVVIASNLFLNSSNDAQGLYVFPCAIPSGTRISARCQNDTTASGTVVVNINTFDGGFTAMEGAAGIESIGLTTSGATSGTTITSAGTLYVKGSYAQLTASTSKDYLGFIVAMGSAFGGTSDFFQVDFAIGAAASEKVILPNIIADVDTTAPLMWPNSTPFFPVSVPSGTRLSARCSTVFATALSIKVSLFGVY